MTFSKYDIVSRTGVDEHIVIGSNDWGDLITVICIKAGCGFRIGDLEDNLPRRYEFIRRGSPRDLPNISEGEFNSI